MQIFLNSPNARNGSNAAVRERNWHRARNISTDASKKSSKKVPFQLRNGTRYITYNQGLLLVAEFFHGNEELIVRAKLHGFFQKRRCCFAVSGTIRLLIELIKSHQHVAGIELALF